MLVFDYTCYYWVLKMFSEDDNADRYYVNSYIGRNNDQHRLGVAVYSHVPSRMHHKGTSKARTKSIHKSNMQQDNSKYPIT